MTAKLQQMHENIEPRTKSSSPIDWLLEKMQGFRESLAVAQGEHTSSYAELVDRYRLWKDRLDKCGVLSGQVVALEGEYNTTTIAALLAAVAMRSIVVPLSSDSRGQHDRFRQLAKVQWRLDSSGQGQITKENEELADVPLYERLRNAQYPGLVLFTSGSTGNSKAAVHDLSLLLEKFVAARQTLRTIVFLQLDHIGGINTLLYTLANGGAVVVPQDRSPAAVCDAIARHSVELLPTSPTFLNLLLLSEAYRHYDLKSLRLITYGTEPMPSSTLERLNQVFPHIRLQQTYGLTELGILRSQSRDSKSLWVRVGGEGYETKVIDGQLAIKARSAMLGYLNAPSPFDEDGFLHTGDRVEIEGPWLRILGRESEVINVGGSKIHPAEVESVLLEMEGVADVAVRGEAHPITGQVVIATVQLNGSETAKAFRARMRLHCRIKLPQFAVPVRVYLSEEPLYNSRFKRMRRPMSTPASLPVNEL